MPTVRRVLRTMWPSCHGSRPDGAAGLENSDSSSKTMSIQLGVLPLGEGEGCEALSSRWRLGNFEKIMIFLTIFEISLELFWSIIYHSRASLVVPRHHLNGPGLIS